MNHIIRYRESLGKTEEVGSLIHTDCTIIRKVLSICAAKFKN